MRGASNPYLTLRFFLPGHRFDDETPVEEVVRVAATIICGARAY